MNPTFNRSSSVDREALGLARQLRQRLTISNNIAVLNQERLLAPLQIRSLPIPEHYLEIHCPHVWETLPEFGRISSKADYRNGKLYLAEVRCVPTRLRYNSWEDADYWESSVSVCQTTVEFTRSPAKLNAERRDIVVYSQHSLTRKIQRGTKRDAIINDLMPLHHYHVSDAEFRLPIDNGFWCGQCRKINGQPVLLVRTYKVN